MLVAAIAPPIGFTVYVLAMFLLVWWHRRRIKRRHVVQNSSLRGSVDLEGEQDDVESKRHRPRRLTFASSVLEMPMSPSINSATPFAAPSRGYSGVMSISPVPTSPLSPTSPISPLGSSPLVPLRAPQPGDNPLPTGRPSASRNSRFRISVPAFVGRLSGGGIPAITGGGGGSGGGIGSAGVGTGGLGGAGGAGGAGSEDESGAGGRRKRRQSRADPVLPRTTTPTVRFNSDDMLAPRRPQPPSIRQHIIHSPRVTAAAAALLASTTPPPPNSPLPPTPLTATLTSASPLSPMPPTPVLSMLPRCASSLSKIREKTRVRPLPPLPLQHQHGLSSASPRRLHLPPPPSQPPPLLSQPQLQSPQAVTTAATTTTATPAAPPSATQTIVLQPNRLHLPEKKEKKEKESPPHSSSSLSRPSQRQNYPFTRIVGHRRRRAQDGSDSPPPYTSQYLDSDNDNS